MRTLTAVLLLLALAPAARAGVLPPAGLTVGGGGFYGKGVGSRLLTIHVSDDGRTLALAGFTFAQCQGRPGLGRLFSGTAQLADDGTFAATLRGRWPGDVFYKGRGSAVVSGTFDGVRASGTVGLAPGAYAIEGRKHRACSSALGAFEARDPGRPAGRATGLVPGQMLYGLTTDHFDGLPLPAVAQVAKTGRRLRTVAVGLRMRCRNEASSFRNFSPRIAVGADGAFRRVEHFPTRYNDAVVRYRVATSGHIAEGGGLVGKVSAGLRAHYTKGRLKGATDRCPRAGSTTFAVIP